MEEGGRKEGDRRGSGVMGRWERSWSTVRNG